MGIREQIDEDLKQAMRARDEDRLAVIRMVRAGIKNAEVAAHKSLDDSGILQVLQKEQRERKDSLEEFRKAGRSDLVHREETQLAILEHYLPEQLSREQIIEEVRAVMAEVGASGPQEKGKLMAALMPRMRGRADGREVNALVTELLGG